MMDKFVLTLKDDLQFTDEEFFQLCQDNRDLRLERDKNGNIII